MTADKPMSYDWAVMLDELIAAGSKPPDIYGGGLTGKMLHYYRNGAQPLHWRGELILSSWCAAFSKDRNQAPVREVVRGHRVDKRLVPGPRVQSLPNWPSPKEVLAGIAGVLPKRRGRPKKVEA